MLNKKCFVLDLDGTVYLGDIPIQETVDFIPVSYTHLTLPTTERV